MFATFQFSLWRHDSKTLFLPLWDMRRGLLNLRSFVSSETKCSMLQKKLLDHFNHLVEIKPWVSAGLVIIYWTGEEFTKAPFPNFFAREIFGLTKVLCRFFGSHSYLTGVTAAELRRHLSNMNVCFGNAEKNRKITEHLTLRRHYVNSFTHPNIRPPTPIPHTLIHSLTHPLFHLPTRSLIHSLTHMYTFVFESFSSSLSDESTRLKASISSACSLSRCVFSSFWKSRMSTGSITSVVVSRCWLKHNSTRVLLWIKFSGIFTFSLRINNNVAGTHINSLRSYEAILWHILRIQRIQKHSFDKEIRAFLIITPRFFTLWDQNQFHTTYIEASTVDIEH